ncbi:Nuc-1 negative regulatory protein preg [Lachnellula hyalina]|uniref:Nuc-1 negative regulatory protein preg n=1 Tax=Lachnellula hyalina TaxID=1316788 RepID=A0A8H8R2V9_9HELO|nr:Nuc-1 negative regulatory protein preg [Lachnellula hyalina]TVY25894.1 Nuc-1 negative regulatory protein preg [Lachnellula hyalina]
MLKSLSHPQSPASSPRFHYAPAAQSLPPPPLSRRDPATSKPQSTAPRTITPRRVQYVDASTQWQSPVMNLKLEGVPSEDVAEREQTQQMAASSSVASVPPHSPSRPRLQAQSPGMKRRQSRDGHASSHNHSQISAPKRAKSAQAQVKVLPPKYEFCEVEDMVILIANMISELIQTNDGLPLRSGVLTRFHSRTPPGISVLDYLQRLAKHATLTPPLLLSMVYYIDRLCSLYPAFTITTLTVHRFLITAATVAAKGLSDSFWNNATYARVGGIKLAELGLLELDFLYRVDWKIVPNPEVLVDYYRGLVERSDGYELENDSSSTEDEEDGDAESVQSKGSPEVKSEEDNDVKWKAWMEDVSTRKAGAADAGSSKGIS